MTCVVLDATYDRKCHNPLALTGVGKADEGLWEE